MVENRPFAQFMAYLTLAIGIVIVAFPVYLAIMASTFDTATIINGNMPLVPGNQADENYTRTLFYGGMHARQPVGIMMLNSMIMAMGIAIGKILISILSAYAVVYFKFPFRKTAFWIIFITLMLPVEVRIYPTYKIVADLGLLDWLGGLPLGLQTPVGERGEQLSAGERQLVALVRARVADPDLLVLDEATSAVDPATEVRIGRAVEGLTQGRTSITIAHRLATAASADLIVVFDRGRVVEQGPHGELVDSGGVYSRLYSAWMARRSGSASRR